VATRQTRKIFKGTIFMPEIYIKLCIATTTPRNHPQKISRLELESTGSFDELKKIPAKVGEQAEPTRE
jgi:hypothetical protein